MITSGCLYGLFRFATHQLYLRPEAMFNHVLSYIQNNDECANKIGSIYFVIKKKYKIKKNIKLKKI